MDKITLSDGVTVIGSVDGGWSGWDAVHALLDVGARKVGRVGRGVLLTGCLRNTVLVGEFVDVEGLSSMA